jgi:hypothetical protein
LEELDGFLPGEMAVVISGEAELVGAVCQPLQVVRLISSGSFRHGGADFRRMGGRVVVKVAVVVVVVVAMDRLIIVSPAVVVAEEAGQQLVVTGTEWDFNLEPEWLLLLLLLLLLSMRLLLIGVTGRR